MDLFVRAGIVDQPKIKGLEYIPDFISTEEEVELIKLIDNQSWLNDLKRRVQHYGWKYNYTARKVDSSMRLGKLPDWLEKYLNRFKAKDIDFDQVIINEYLPGQGISAHIDCVSCFEENIASLSLGSDCIMEFSDQRTKIPTLLERRSLAILSGDARYKWKHSIPSRKTDKFNGLIFNRNRRLSLTFRKVILT